MTLRAEREALRRLAGAAPLGVAFSGGGDSTALLVLAAERARAEGLRMEAAIVDHRLRPGSGAEAERAASFAADLGVRAEILPWPDAPGAGNLQAAARAARHALLAAWARRRGLAAVALGHTMDDQAETVLLRLARGGGVDGLSAMRAETEAEGVRFLRPLLGARRGALRDFLRGRGIGWVEDPSNDNPRFDRVRARQALAALAPLGIDAEGLAATATRLAGQRAALEAAAKALVAAALAWGGAGEAVLLRAPLAAAPRDTALRALDAALRGVSRDPYRPRQPALDRALDAVLAAGPPRTLSGVLIEPGAEAATLCREPARLPPPRPMQERREIYDRRWLVSWEGGERGAALGPLGPAGLSALSDACARGWRAPPEWAAAPRAARQGAPGIWRGATLLAAPLAGYGEGASAELAPWP